MSHHKRRRPKNRRSGCLMCKYWKVNGAKRKSPRVQVARANEAMMWEVSRVQSTTNMGEL
jgi:hypothetical protein